MIVKRTFKKDIDPSIHAARFVAAKYNLWRDALKMDRHIDGFIEINQIDSDMIELSSNTYEMEERDYNVFKFTPKEDTYLKYRTFKG